jgi:antitoxin YefM
MVQTTYTSARNNLASLLDKVTTENEVVVVTRRNAEPVALIAESELRGIMETLHLLRSPENRRRLIESYERSVLGEVAPSSVESLRREVGLNER